MHLGEEVLKVAVEGVGAGDEGVVSWEGIRVEQEGDEISEGEEDDDGGDLGGAAGGDEEIDEVGCEADGGEGEEEGNDEEG